MQKTITALKIQKRYQNRVNIFLDNEFAFGLFTINVANLKVGQLISQSAIDKLQHEDHIEEGYQKALRFISFKPRTQFEIRKKLSESEFSEEIINIVINKLVQKGYVNDFEFAQNWAENRSIYKPRSKKLISWELKNKKVNKEIIDEVIIGMVPDEKLAVLASEKYARRLSGCDKDVFFRRLTGYLSRRGFSYSIVKPIVEETWVKLRQIKSEN
jgi:regulatory protein